MKNSLARLYKEALHTDVETRAEGTDWLPCPGEIGIGPYTVVIFLQNE